jgi:hypothetical protein
MPDIAPLATSTAASTKTNFVADTSSVNLTFNISTLEKKVSDVTTLWSENNLNLTYDAKMWQARNQNVQKALELTQKDSNLIQNVTVQVPTQDGKAIDMTKITTTAQQEATWKEAVSGYKYAQDASGNWVMARDANGQLIKSNMTLQDSSMSGINFLKNYEGVTQPAYKEGTGSDDNTRANNQTIINNVMSANSNKLSQATTASNFAISQLQTALNTIQQLFTEFFNALKQISNSISA